MAASLVTGGAGFIGSTLVRALLERGDAVRVLDNFSTGERENLAGLNGSLEILEDDLRSRSALTQAVDGIDFIFHEAAFVSVPASMKDPETCFDVNVYGTVNLLSAARTAGVKRVVLASSAAVYGDADLLPLQEKTTSRPLSPYAASKMSNELYAQLYTEIFDLETVCLRYFNVYGPRQSPANQYAAAIPIFIRTMLDDRPPIIFGDGTQARDFIFVEDVVRANLRAAEVSGAAGRTYNICSGTEISILDLLNSLNSVLGCNLDPVFAAPRAGDIYRSLGDPSLSRDFLGFEAATSLEEGLGRTAAWMRG
jgi:UDP-N-acetylglucosamine/UDP-N-acetyl-alpha-D-glucosaminouronate 4-epimerase